MVLKKMKALICTGVKSFGFIESAFEPEPRWRTRGYHPMMVGLCRIFGTPIGPEVLAIGAGPIDLRAAPRKLGVCPGLVGGTRDRVRCSFKAADRRGFDSQLDRDMFSPRLREGLYSRIRMIRNHSKPIAPFFRIIIVNFYNLQRSLPLEAAAQLARQSAGWASRTDGQVDGGSDRSQLSPSGPGRWGMPLYIERGGPVCSVLH